jgi:hypothetical protein
MACDNSMVVESSNAIHSFHPPWDTVDRLCGINQMHGRYYISVDLQCFTIQP